MIKAHARWFRHIFITDPTYHDKKDKEYTRCGRWLNKDQTTTHTSKITCLTCLKVMLAHINESISSIMQELKEEQAWRKEVETRIRHYKEESQ